MENKLTEPINEAEADVLEKPFEDKLADLLNCHNWDSVCNMSDKLLANYIINCLNNLADIVDAEAQS